MKNLLALIFLFFSLGLLAQEKKKDSIQKWKVHGKLLFQFNQANFSNWISGGQDNVSGNLAINYDFNYKNNRWNWDNKFITGYGLSHINGEGFRKTNDRFEYNSLLGLKSQGYWFFSFILNFKSQYTRGFDYSKTPNTSVSDFLSPAYLTLGPGFLWKKSDDFRINIAPATIRYTFVNDLFSGQFGVKEGRNTNFGFGFNLSAFYKTDIMENINLENILAVYSDYLDNPENIDIEHQLNFFFKVNKFINMNITLHTIIDSNASSKIQFRELFGMGVNYSFHKKVIYQLNSF
jgi:hypothetical protein